MELKRKKDLPLYEIVIGEEDNTGINLVSLVDDPAIEIKGQYFAKKKRFKFYDRPPVHPNCKCYFTGEGLNKKWNVVDPCNHCIEKKEKFERSQKRKRDRNNRKNKGKSSQPGSRSFSSNKEQQIIIAPALIPDFPIYRKDEDGTEYEVFFSKETIEKMVYKFNSKNKNNAINIDHTNQMVDAAIVQNWIVMDKVYDTSQYYNIDVPVGSWIVMMKINDPEIWETQVKKLEKYGFSIEGILGQRLVEMCKDYEEEIIEEEFSIEEYLEMLEHFSIEDLQEIIQSVNREI